MIRNIATAVVNAITAKPKAPTPSQTLKITGIYRESAQETISRLAGGWAVELSCYPETRPTVEKWLQEAIDRAWESRADANLYDDWFRVAEQLAAILSIASTAHNARVKPEGTLQ